MKRKGKGGMAVRQLERSVMAPTEFDKAAPMVRDAEGLHYPTKRALTLIEKLMLRSQGKALPAPKRGRGRPPKGVSA